LFENSFAKVGFTQKQMQDGENLGMG